MTEGCLLATGEHCGHPPSLNRKTAMSNCVDTMVHPAQAAGSDSVKDMVLVEPHSPKLRDGRHAVLLRCDLRHKNVWAGAIVGHIPTKATGPANSPPAVSG